ncbi:hypothetical protein Cni_G12705 [Canna indica]|uniref:Uncharacterized protein n=1 Tax=Canna indica TaxID=4628 RepID=A0AAQ3K8N4_9LILI|nr:hypothetical protein Cni_G12705 [Canna indica]
MDKRRRPADDDGVAKRGRRSVTDQEADEFFAILRQLRAASRFFTIKGGDDGDKKKSSVGDEDVNWRPAFAMEDFDAVKNAGSNSKHERVAEAEEPIQFRRELDLNTEPAEGPRVRGELCRR